MVMAARRTVRRARRREVLSEARRMRQWGVEEIRYCRSQGGVRLGL